MSARTILRSSWKSVGNTHIGRNKDDELTKVNVLVQSYVQHSFKRNILHIQTLEITKIPTHL